jgi:hypothetical protein
MEADGRQCLKLFPNGLVIEKKIVTHNSLNWLSNFCAVIYLIKLFVLGVVFNKKEAIETIFVIMLCDTVFFKSIFIDFTNIV